MDIPFEIQMKILRIPVILIALTIHELSHGLAALYQNDTTAKDAGRLTLNPIKHLDLFGALMLFFGPFGWARPVPVNPYNFRRMKAGIIQVSAAGPLSNIVLAIISGLLFRVAMAWGIDGPVWRYVYNFLVMSFLLNLGLAFFNLLPIPPLDGSKIIMAILPADVSSVYYRYMQHGWKVFVGIILLEAVTGWQIFSPVYMLGFRPFLNFFQLIVFGKILIDI